MREEARTAGVGPERARRVEGGAELQNCRATELQNGTEHGRLGWSMWVAGLKYAMSGLDELSGTDDDYTFTLVYNGLTTSTEL